MEICCMTQETQIGALEQPRGVRKGWRWKGTYVCAVLCLVTQSCLTLSNPMDCSLPGSFVHRILQVRILKWVDYPFSRGSFWPRNRTKVSCIAGRFFNSWATREAQTYVYLWIIHVDVWQKPNQHCKAMMILQLKIKEFLGMELQFN